MQRKTDKDDKVNFQMGRIAQQNGEWFYEARNGEQRGPFKTRVDAERHLTYFILECQKNENFKL